MKLTLSKGLAALAWSWPPSTWACATCGQGNNFTAWMWVLSSGFFILPVCFVILIAWRLRKDHLLQQKKESDKNSL